MTTTRQSTNRREFLARAGLATLGGIASLAPATLPAARADSQPRRLKRPLSPQEFRKNLAGPILSLPTTFTEKLEVDYEAVHAMIARARRYKVPVFGLTAGNSKYRLLSYEEIKGVTKAMVEAASGDGLTIAATGDWPTKRVIDYARYSESLGADAMQILLPKDIKAEDQLFAHFKAVSENTRLPIVLHGQYSPSLLRKLVTIESIVAMKEDAALTYYIDRAMEFGDRLEIFSGGAESRYLVGYPYGCRAFFSTYTSFAPDISMKFWAAIRAKDLKKAVAITKQYDHPFIKRFSHPFWHATLEYFGVAKRYMRPPFKTYTDKQMAEVKAFYDGQNLYPKDYARN